MEVIRTEKCSRCGHHVEILRGPNGSEIFGSHITSERPGGRRKGGCSCGNCIIF